jgi:CRISPR-associated exonuclease Cas4
LSPVEYKHGRPKSGYCDKVQLCAQALCLEEMLHTRISSGAIYYGRMRKRLPVDFDDALRDATKSLAGRLHELTRKGLTPPADYTRKCRNCSLLSVCLPRVTSGRRSVKRYLATALEESGKTDKEILP